HAHHAASVPALSAPHPPSQQTHLQHAHSSSAAPSAAANTVAAAAASVTSPGAVAASSSSSASAAPTSPPHMALAGCSSPAAVSHLIAASQFHNDAAALYRVAESYVVAWRDLITTPTDEERLIALRMKEDLDVRGTLMHMPTHVHSAGASVGFAWL